MNSKEPVNTLNDASKKPPEATTSGIIDYAIVARGLVKDADTP